jgi:predicted Zn-ribbon and HTH transcriptional regulator
LRLRFYGTAAILSAVQDDPQSINVQQESHVRQRVQQAARQQPLRPGALCPACGGHAFRRAELKAGTPCPKCGQKPLSIAA